ncbi:MAG: biotin--[acetyl-CoA-carboxylase] ligase [bacterium]
MKAGIKILRILKSNEDNFVSGQELGNKFKISRTAIWKSVQRLRAKGYKIRAGKKKGYRLINVPDFLLPTEIQYGLKTKFIGRDMRYFTATDSTNEQAKKLASRGAAEGTVLIAEKQTRGKGRLGRHWVSPAGGIWMSVILRPDFAPSQAPMMTMVASLAVAGAIKEVTGLEAKIKWPNDVMIEINKNGVMRKVCGILTEMGAEVDRIHYLVVGIGINVNNQLPKELGHTACSLDELAGKVPRTLLARKVLEKLEYYYFLWLEKGAQVIMKEGRRLSAVLGRTIKVATAEGLITGKAIDIDNKGALILRLKNKTKKEILAGEVTLHL